MKQCLSPGPDLDLFSPPCTSAQDGLAHPLAAMNSSWLPLTQTFPEALGRSWQTSLEKAGEKTF